MTSGTKTLTEFLTFTGSFIKDFASANLPIKAIEATEAVQKLPEAKKKL